MMCYYLNVHFQGQRVNLITGSAQIFLTYVNQRSGVLTTALLDSSILWDITPCTLVPIHINPHNIISHKTQTIFFESCAWVAAATLPRTLICTVWQLT